MKVTCNIDLSVPINRVEKIKDDVKKRIIPSRHTQSGDVTRLCVTKDDNDKRYIGSSL